ncbi:MAG: alpha/beta hydrolase [Rubrivivax sp.]|jgi:pimeloyl-ACP methyl ester carboxylesterase|nr:alpha/beta hydrolase [Rubrivivax sp.]
MNPTPSSPGPAGCLTLLPGLGCDEELFAGLLPALRAAGHVCRVSTAHTRHDTMAAMATEIADTLQGATGPHRLVGCSMGAMLALMAAAQAPDAVAGLVLIGTSARPDPPDIVRLREWAAGEFEAGRIDPVLAPNVALALHEDSARDPVLVGRYLTMVRRAGGASLARQNRAVAARADLRPLLPRITAPTLVLCGDADQITPLEHAREIAHLLPDAELQLVPGTGHLPTLEQPARVLERLLPWLAAQRVF